MKYYPLPVLAVLLLGMLSCHSAKKAAGVSVTLDTLTVSANKNPMDIYREATPIQWQLEHTKVALSFDYKNKTAEGRTTIELRPYYYPMDSLQLDAKSMIIDTVALNGKLVPFTYKEDKLTLNLEKTYTRQEKCYVYIHYKAQPYAGETGGSSAITDDRGLYFINTDQAIPGKPVQIWTQGETEANSHWMPTIDKPNMRTTRIELELTVPDSMQTLSNGTLISSVKNGTMRTDKWAMAQPIQVYAIMFAVGRFSIVKDEWNGREVSYYVEPEYEPYARMMFKNTPEMIRFFSGITGVTYPWTKYSQVVVRDYVSGAMENTTASLFGEFMNQNSRELADKDYEDVVSHELFHQWFGDYVTAESWSNLTVNESFATYGEYLWRAYKYGNANADELIYEDLMRYINASQYSDPPLVRFHYRDKEHMFDRISYQKGGAILRYLHHLAGDSAFYHSMRHYLYANALRPAEATHWRLALETVTGRDWNWFFNQWYLKGKHPVLHVQYNYEDSGRRLVVTVVQDSTAGIFDLPLQTLVITNKQSDTVDWRINKKKQTFTYASDPQHPTVVVPDIPHVLPGVINEKNKSPRHWLTQFDHTTDYRSKLNALKSLAAGNSSDSIAKVLLGKALGDSMDGIRKEAVAITGSVKDEKARRYWANRLLAIADTDKNNTVRSRAFTALGTWKIKEAMPLAEKSIWGSSYLVSGEALYALYKLDPSKGHGYAVRLLGGKPNTNLDNNAWKIIGKEGRPKDTTLIQQYADNKGGDRNYLIVHLKSYAGNTQNLAAFRTALQYMADAIAGTENKSWRSSYAGQLKELFEEQKEEPSEQKEIAQEKMQAISQLAEHLSATETDKEILELYKSVKR